MKRLAVLVLLVSNGCAVVQRVDSAIDCGGICERYASCYDRAYDVSACAARCRTSASESTDFRRKADVCNACLEGRSCVSAFACASECLAVVP